MKRKRKDGTAFAELLASKDQDVLKEMLSLVYAAANRAKRRKGWSSEDICRPKASNSFFRHKFVTWFDRLADKQQHPRSPWRSLLSIRQDYNRAQLVFQTGVAGVGVK